MLELEKVEVVYNQLATAITGVTINVPEGAVTAVLGYFLPLYFYLKLELNHIYLLRKDF